MSEMKQFSWRFQEEARHNATEAHLWLSVILRPEESNFTRAQRLACCLTLLFLTMISNAMFYGQDTGYNSYQITIGPIILSITNLYISTISVLLTAPPLFITAYLFRNSGQKHNTKQKSDEMKIEYNKKSLPNWCVLVSWTILTAGVIVSGFFLILYSMEWGKSKSNTWLMNFFTSFFESVFIVDPIKIIGIAVVMSFVMKNSRNIDRTRFDKNQILKTKKTLDSSPVQYLIGTLRKKSIHTINKEELDRLRIRRQQELTARQTLRDILIYMVFLFVLYTVSISNRDSRWFYAKQHLEEELINVQETKTTMKFEEVKTINNFYAWVNDTLIPFMFPVKSITSTLLNANQRLYVNDQVNFKIGPLRLRQLRIKDEVSCTINRSCFGGYDIGKDDESNYCVSWNIEPCSLGEDVYNITSPAWIYTSSRQDVGMPVIGNLATYSGGGYMAEFAVNNLISKQYLYELYTNMWIDRKTRAVFTEFTIYNVHNNVFIYVSMLAEFMEVGDVLTSSSINLFRPFQHVGQNGVLILVCETIASIGCIILSIKTLIAIWRSGRRYFKRFWNVVDLVIIILFFVSVGMYIGRHIIIQYIMNIFAKNKNKFVNFSSMAKWDEMLNVMVSTLIFLTTLRIMRVLSYNERINQIGVVLSYVGSSLLGCFVLSFIVFSDFLICGHLIFGRHLYTYKDLAISSTTLLNAIIGKNSINDLFSVDPIIGRIYYFLFVFFVLWILMSIFNANLNFGITHVRQNFRQSSDKYGISNVLMDIISYISEPFSQLKYKAKTDNVLLNSQSVFSNAVGVTHRQHNITDLMTSGEKETSTMMLKRRSNWNKYV